MGLFAILLGKDYLHHSVDHRFISLSDADQQKFALEMHATALPSGAQDLACGSLPALMGVADH